jgi:hypothetical protein
MLIVTFLLVYCLQSLLIVVCWGTQWHSQQVGWCRHLTDTWQHDAGTQLLLGCCQSTLHS